MGVRLYFGGPHPVGAWVFWGPASTFPLGLVGRRIRIAYGKR